MSEMLTDAERKLVGDLGACANQFSKVVGDGPTRAADCTEFVHGIHILQQQVMSQAAGRAYPDEFRLLGETLRPKAQP